MSRRSRLPNRRDHECFELNWQGLRWSVGVGRDRLGNVAEIFVVDRCKSSPAFEAALRDATIAISIGLQCGADLETLRGAITRNSDGSPASAVGAVLDLLAEGER